MPIEYKIKHRIKQILGMDKIKYSLKKEYLVNTEEYREFENQVVIVTGGSGALGRAISIMFACYGATVYIACRNMEKIATVISEINSLKCGKVYSLKLDVTNNESISSAFDEVIGKEGRIDVLVNCAGGGARENAKPLHEQDIEILDNVISTNLRGTMLCSRKVAPIMIRYEKGKIINFCSSIGIQGMQTCVDYAAVKSGMIGLTKSLAKELGIYGINVNCISPGYIERIDFNESKAQWLFQSNILHKIGTYEDVANAVIFLASDKAGFITGHNLIVDGGRTLGLVGTN